MSLLSHVIIAASYVLVSATTAFTLPHGFPELSPELALVLGGLLLVGFTILHEVFVRVSRTSFVDQRLAALYAANDEVFDEITLARNETRQIREALIAANGDGANHKVREVMNEIGMLRALVERLSTEHRSEPAVIPPAAKTGEITVTTEADSAQRPGKQRKPMPPVKVGLNENQVLDIVRRGLRRGSIDLFLQPIVRLPQRRPEYYECFSRIRTGDGSMIVPEQYIAIAEREGLVTDIDNLLLFRCVQLVRRTQKQDRGIGFFLNISKYTLADKAFLQDFVDFLQGNPELAPDLIFEFRQEDVAEAAGEAGTEIHRLSALGFPFSMDKVTDLDLDGAELAQRGFRFVKIEAAALIPGLDQEPNGARLTRLRSELRLHGIRLIVEKLETEESLIEVLDHGIDLGQGYLFSEPRLGRD
jgi:cyclic-di-GMP phosphodiesterase TipF (flagellum assembly factor)